MEPDEKLVQRRTAIAGMVVCLVPLVYALLWIYIVGNYDTQPERWANYKVYLPPILQNPTAASWVFIVLSAAAVVLSVFGMRQPNRLVWAFSLVTIIIGSMLTLLLLWSML